MLSSALKFAFSVLTLFICSQEEHIRITMVPYCLLKCTISHKLFEFKHSWRVIGMK